MPVSAYNRWAYLHGIVYEPIRKRRKKKRKRLCSNKRGQIASVNSQSKHLEYWTKPRSVNTEVETEAMSFVGSGTGTWTVGITVFFFISSHTDLGEHSIARIGPRWLCDFRGHGRIHHPHCQRIQRIPNTKSRVLHRAQALVSVHIRHASIAFVNCG